MPIAVPEHFFIYNRANYRFFVYIVYRNHISPRYRLDAEASGIHTQIGPRFEVQFERTLDHDVPSESKIDDERD